MVLETEAGPLAPRLHVGGKGEDVGNGRVVPDSAAERERDALRREGDENEQGGAERDPARERAGGFGRHGHLLAKSYAAGDEQP